ncbi:discoidin domain-containing protein [Nocardia africana]|uniref:Discoidin domain-containing protein n=1 Tax=Nocardia africana TaxID=134964 RepID=A0ABW6NU06_9NOCA
MSDQDLADVFARHRGAVLDALLSEPGLSTASGVADQPDVGAPSSAGVSASMADSAPVYSEAPPRSVANAARPLNGPKASDRIMALLNGESPGGPSGLEFTSDFADRAGARLERAGADEAKTPASEPDKPTQPERSSRSDKPAGAAAPAQQLLAMVRKPKVAIALAGVLVIVIILALVTTGGKKDGGDQVKVVTAAAAAPPTAAPKPSDSLTAGTVIQVKSAESHCPSGSTPGMDAFSGQADKAWSCVRAYRVDGQVLTIDLGKTYRIDSVGIVPGWDSIGSDGSDQWTKFRTVSRVSYRFNDPGVTTYTQQTMDQRSIVVTKINPPVTASKITLTILESKGDAAINTTAISSIVVTGQ